MVARARQLDLLERCGAQSVGASGRIERKTYHLQRLLRAALRLRTRDPAGLAIIGGEGDVLDQRQLVERPRDLERPPDPLMTDCVPGKPPISLPLKRIEPELGRRLPAIRLTSCFSRSVRTDEP